MTSASRLSNPAPPEFSRARLVDRREYRALQACVAMALEVLEASVAAVRADPALQNMAVAGHPYASALIGLIDEEVEPIARFDAFVDDTGTLRFLEYNPGLCGGAFNAYRAAQVFLESEAGRALARSQPVEAINTPRLFVDAVWTACSRSLGREARVVALLWPQAAPAELSREMEAFERLQAERGGVLVSVGAADVERRDGALFAGGRRIDALFVMDWEAMGAADSPLAINLTQTWVANTLGATIFRGGKHLFAVMSDPALGARFTSEQRAWINRHIPWTRMLPPPGDQSEAAGKLRADAIARQEDLIIKPSLGRGGKGIVAGWAVSAEDWRRTLTREDADAYLIQQRVTPRPEPPFDDAAPPGAAVFADLCMFVWNNRDPEGLVSRASAGWLLNVSAGEAKAVPVLVCG